MRIVEEFGLGTWKCTIFHHMQHFYVKIENGLLKQEYKVRQGLGLNPGELKAHFSEKDIQQKIESCFETMHGLMPKRGQELDEFDEII